MLVCDNCGYKTPDRTTLTQHIEAIHNNIWFLQTIQTPENVQKCKKCEFKALTSEELRTHTEGHDDTTVIDASQS